MKELKAALTSTLVGTTGLDYGVGLVGVAKKRGFTITNGNFLAESTETLSNHLSDGLLVSGKDYCRVLYLTFNLLTGSANTTIVISFADRVVKKIPYITTHGIWSTTVSILIPPTVSSERVTISYGSTTFADISIIGLISTT